MADFIMVTVVVLRLVVPLFIPKFPLPAIVLALIIDGVDQTIFQIFTDSDLPGYQSYDKALDVYYLAIAYLSTMRNWREPVAFDIARFLFLFRLVGVAFFEATQWRWILMVFPNTFEYYFIAYEAIRTRWNPFVLKSRQVAGLAAAIWVFIKLPQEWWIHVAQFDVTDTLAEYPIGWLVIFGGLGLIGFVVWSLRGRIPAPDWPFTVRVDDHLQLSDYEGRGRERFFSAILVEKIMLCALIAVIFSQVIPGVQATDTQLAIGVTVLVVANTLISQVIRRFGKVWASSFTQFLATLAINIAIVWVDARFGGDSRVYGLRWSTVFYMVMLSFLMALFDRYRLSRDPQERIDVMRTLRSGEITPPLARRPS
ncbi:MAG: hypothetical protein M9952_12105 [Microthrixaceae bacterium]|nr:hypothetical protein [Microthrixaceae bacterium]MCO5313665.1 hypothetical protein [Microthrixaceae bacterium]HPB45958.1 hypothetical protein [Microthrixaceae bacterium]